MFWSWFKKTHLICFIEEFCQFTPHQKVPMFRSFLTVFLSLFCKTQDVDHYVIKLDVMVCCWSFFIHSGFTFFTAHSHWHMNQGKDMKVRRQLVWEFFSTMIELRSPARAILPTYKCSFYAACSIGKFKLKVTILWKLLMLVPWRMILNYFFVPLPKFKGFKVVRKA